MIATDIAARGIDVTRISHVINYDMPSTADAYTHRIGRTGRASKTGDAFTFVTGQDVGLASSLKKVLGEKLQYHSVDGLTVTLPLTATPAPTRAIIIRATESRIKAEGLLLSATNQVETQDSALSVRKIVSTGRINFSIYHPAAYCGVVYFFTP